MPKKKKSPNHCLTNKDQTAVGSCASTTTTTTQTGVSSTTTVTTPPLSSPTPLLGSPAGAAQAQAQAPQPQRGYYYCFYPCNHGCTQLTSPDRSVYERETYLAATRSLAHAELDARSTLATVNDDPYEPVTQCLRLHHSHLDLKLLIEAMVYVSVETLLQIKDPLDPTILESQQDKEMAFHFLRIHGKVIMALNRELLLQEGAWNDTMENVMIMELFQMSDCNRETVKFFDQRVTCDCLKPLLKIASTQEIGVCCFPECTVQAEEGRNLLRCSSCKVMVYCSKACQRKHWPDHKEGCREMRKIRESKLHIPSCSASK